MQYKYQFHRKLNKEFYEKNAVKKNLFKNVSFIYREKKISIFIWIKLIDWTRVD